MDDAEKLARQRFFIIGLVRMIGTLGMAFGAAIAVGNNGTYPLWLGYASLVIGTVMMVFLPRQLAARWRTPPES